MRGSLVGLLVLAVGAGLALAPVVAGAEEKELPDAATIFQEFIDATGGAEAYEAVHNRVVIGAIRIPGQEVEGQLTFFEAAPNKSYLSMILGQGGISEGTDGEVAWERSFGRDPTLVEGKAKDLAIREATFHWFLKWEDLFESGTCKKIEKVHDRQAYKVELKAAKGEGKTVFFDTESHLLVQEKFKVETEGGKVDVVKNYFDYQEVDGLLLPHRVVNQVGGFGIDVTVESIDHNAELPEDRFAPPEELLDQIKKDADG